MLSLSLGVCMCVYSVLPFYRKRQQYRVDLIAKIIFIYGFPFIVHTIPSYSFSYRFQYKHTHKTHTNIIRGASNRSFDGIS